MENLLDIDFDGGAPASAQKEPGAGMSGLEGLAGTPTRVESPAVGTPTGSNNLDDLLGVFGDSGNAMGGPSSGGAAPNGGTGSADLMNGMAGLDLMGGGSSSSNPTSPPPPGGNQKKTNEDIMSLF